VVCARIVLVVVESLPFAKSVQHVCSCDTAQAVTVFDEMDVSQDDQLDHGYVHRVPYALVLVYLWYLLMVSNVLYEEFITVTGFGHLRSTWGWARNCESPFCGIRPFSCPRRPSALRRIPKSAIASFWVFLCTVNRWSSKLYHFRLNDSDRRQ